MSNEETKPETESLETLYQSMLELRKMVQSGTAPTEVEKAWQELKEWLESEIRKREH